MNSTPSMAATRSHAGHEIIIESHPPRMNQHLIISTPSPSTISYTVSSLSKPRGLVIVVIRHIIRMVFAFYAVLTVLLRAVADDMVDGFYHGFIAELAQWTPFGEFVDSVARDLAWWLILLSTVLILCLCLRRDYLEESLLVLQGLGVQTSTSSPFYFMNPSTTFIPTTQIQDIVIHEAFKGFGVRFYLAIIVDGATEVVVVFPNLLPKRLMLEEIWRGSRKCLYGGTT